MDLKKWTQMKRSGGFRRKVIAKYKKLQETSENMIIQKKCDIGNETSGSVHFSNCQNKVTVTETDCSQESNSCSFSSDLTKTFLEEASEEDQENWCETHTEDENYEFRENIRQWALKCNIPLAHLHDLFSILNKRLPFVLPKDPRTLLKTNALEICISSICSGHYWHNGLKIQLKNILEAIIEVPTQISLNINIDGLPIYNSSRHQLWPILCNIFELSSISPIVIGIYEGQSKPSDLSAYLGPSVSELKELENGLDVTTKQGKLCKVNVKVRAFLCDSPARALIKGVANFNAKDGCLKCTIRGEYSHVTHTVTFPGTNHVKRTDNDFRLKKYGNHHKVDSPLLQLSIDMIEDIPVSDSLHLIDLGIMKRLLMGWRDGNFGKLKTKWSARDIDKVSTFLSKCQLPKEIHRSVRTIEVLAHWKASEYRSFLFYLSFIILKHVLSPEAYSHFLSFFCAITICSSAKYTHFLRLAESLLIFFVEKYKSFYGAEYITSNVHNLSHLVDEVRKFGILQTYSTYPFENKLYTIKNLLRQGNKPLQQVARRLLERSCIEREHLSNQQSLVYPFLKKNKTMTNLHFESFMLSPQNQNKWFLNKDSQILGLNLILTDQTTGEILLKAVQVKNICDVFETPIKSSLLKIFKCSTSDLEYCESEKIYKIVDVQCKMVCIEYQRNVYFIPLLHSL